MEHELNTNGIGQFWNGKNTWGNASLVCLYLSAAILANLSSAYFGPGASIVNAFLFIGLDLTSRDKLHDAWGGRWIMPKMALLIIAGSVISWLINRNAGQIAIASMVAFAASGMIDAIVYHILRNKSWMMRANGSNIPSALVDSVLFPTIAFGGFMPAIVLGQFAAKILGGFVWSWILHTFRNKMSEK